MPGCRAWQGWRRRGASALLLGQSPSLAAGADHHRMPSRFLSKSKEFSNLINASCHDALPCPAPQPYRPPPSRPTRPLPGAARKALVPVLVPASQLHLAATVDSWAWSITGAVGASVGGVVASKLGKSACFLVVSVGDDFGCCTRCCAGLHCLRMVRRGCWCVRHNPSNSRAHADVRMQGQAQRRAGLRVAPGCGPALTSP